LDAKPETLEPLFGRLLTRARGRFSCTLWAEQVYAFLRHVVGAPAFLAGNSLGGYVSVMLASQVPSGPEAGPLRAAARRRTGPALARVPRSA
jgi:pimeloyl-ACP methyl ester carboxylesterase